MAKIKEYGPANSLSRELYRRVYSLGKRSVTC